MTIKQKMLVVINGVHSNYLVSRVDEDGDELEVGLIQVRDLDDDVRMTLNYQAIRAIKEAMEMLLPEAVVVEEQK